MADDAVGPAMNPLWLAGRATGLVSLLLLSAAVVLGTLDATRTAGHGGRASWSARCTATSRCS